MFPSTPPHLMLIYLALIIPSTRDIKILPIFNHKPTSSRTSRTTHLLGYLHSYLPTFLPTYPPPTQAKNNNPQHLPAPRTAPQRNATQGGPRSRDMPLRKHFVVCDRRRKERKEKHSGVVGWLVGWLEMGGGVRRGRCRAVPWVCWPRYMPT